MLTSDTGRRYGELVRLYRLKRGKSLRAVAAEIGLSPVYLSEVERGAKAAFNGAITSILELSLSTPPKTLHRAAVRDYCATRGYLR